MGNLIIAVMDGAGASFRRQHHPGRSYISDIMRHIMGDFIIDSFPEYEPYVFESVRGGAIFSKRRRIRRFIQANNKPANVLLAIGKSYGGRNIVDILTELHGTLQYKYIVLMLVDACWIGRKIGPATIKPPRVDQVYNYFQENNRYLQGARLDSSDLNGITWQEWDLSLSVIRGYLVDHFSIEQHPKIAHDVRAVLLGLKLQLKEHENGTKTFKNTL